jgi:hypothetical protein
MHGANYLIQRHLVVARRAHRHTSGIDGLDRSEGIPFDTGNLDKAPDWITGHTQVMLHADFSCMFYLLVRSFDCCDETCSRHRTGDTNFALTTYFSA